MDIVKQKSKTLLNKILKRLNKNISIRYKPTSMVADPEHAIMAPKSLEKPIYSDIDYIVPNIYI